MLKNSSKSCTFVSVLNFRFAEDKKRDRRMLWKTGCIKDKIKEGSDTFHNILHPHLLLRL